MANTSTSKCERCRRAGEKLYLKGDRCDSPKCAMTRRPYAPGDHGKSGGRSKSDFGKQLNEKQKLKRMYGVSEKQFKKHLDEAKKKKSGVVGDNLLIRLELRMDNVIYRLGLASSRSHARQLVSHGMFLVGGRKLNIPSAEILVGAEVEIKDSKKEKNYFKDLQLILKKNHKTPEWLILEPEALKAKVLSKPNVDKVAQGIDVPTVIEYYSRS